MDIKKLIFFIILCFIVVDISAIDKDEQYNTPKDGYVPDKETAISIAVAVWKPIYGAKNIQNNKPYNAHLENGVWHISGTLPKGWVGGVPEAEIDKKSGKILSISHEK